MDQLLVKGQDVKQRWQRYFDNLFNRENETMDTQLDDSFDDLNRCFVLTLFWSAKYSRRTGGGALWSGADGPRPGPDGPRPGVRRRCSLIKRGRSAAQGRTVRDLVQELGFPA